MPHNTSRRALRCRWWPVALALAVSVAWRLPMWINATDRLDSDMACNGLTLKRMLEGGWRWHLPGIHYMGVTEVVLALPAALVFGANAYTLTAGPILAYGLFVVATYFLVRQLYGLPAARWSLVATAFVSPDLLFWSTFAIGGHVLITFWHLVTLLLLLAYLRSGKDAWLFVLGVWSGLGLYTYHMYLYTIALTLAVLIFARAGPQRRLTSLRSSLWAVAGFAIGWLPHHAGLRSDPWDVYGSQVSQIGILHTPRTLVVLKDHCLPKFVTGLHNQSDVEKSQRTAELFDAARVPRSAAALSVLACWLLVGFAYYAMLWNEWRQGRAKKSAAAAADSLSARDPYLAVKSVVAATPPLVIAGFLTHPAVVNDTNSRYLIYLMAWWPIAFAAVAPRMWEWKRNLGGLLAAGVVVGYGILLVDFFHREGWVNAVGGPVREPPRPVVEYLSKQREFRYFYADYWDAYRFTFLTDEHVRGLPIELWSIYYWPKVHYKNLRIPEYAHEAASQAAAGLVVRLDRWPAPGHPPGWTLVYAGDPEYRVYVRGQAATPGHSLPSSLPDGSQR